MAEEYDIVQAFQRIEEELIASMKRNLSRHLKEEKKEGFNWSMWQTEQLNSLNEFKKQNPELFKKYFSTIDKDVEDVIKKAYETGQLKQEQLILETLKKGKAKKTSSSFFKINDRKLKALIEEAQTGIQKSSLSILRYTNDKYRKIIFNAQVYANSGAGTAEKAIDMATKDFFAAGINSIEYSNGNRVNIASYAAMAIKTATTRAHMQGEGSKRDEWGIHTVLVPNRGGGCPFCSKYQGKVFIDNVWSGGTEEESKETGYPLLSTAIDGGLFHPNCKDKVSTYFPGINLEPVPPTKEELEKKKQNYMHSQKIKNAELSIEKYKRLELGCIDDENIKKYHDKRLAWQEYKKRLTKNADESFFGVTKNKNSGIMNTNSNTTVDGKNLIGKFELTEDEKYDDGGINRVMEMQGYKGNPKVVDNDEFEKLTEESNFFAQRTYGGKNEQEVRGYQKQLYSGEWYIDCSVGGSQYGKGMYCAATYDISNQKSIGGIMEESKHYKLLAHQRKNNYIITEDFTIDKTARVIKFNDITKEYIKQVGKIDNWTDKENNIYAMYSEASRKKIDAYQNYLTNWRSNNNNPQLLAEFRKYEGEAAKIKSQFTSKMKESYKRISNKDISTLAVEMGYDAINAEGHGQSGSYTVILNRTKLIIRRGGYYNVEY